MDSGNSGHVRFRFCQAAQFVGPLSVDEGTQVSRRH
jgi:hypothetical protein